MQRLTISAEISKPCWLQRRFATVCNPQPPQPEQANARARNGVAPSIASAEDPKDLLAAGEDRGQGNRLAIDEPAGVTNAVRAHAESWRDM